VGCFCCCCFCYYCCCRRWCCARAHSDAGIAAPRSVGSSTSPCPAIALVVPPTAPLLRPWNRVLSFFSGPTHPPLAPSTHPATHPPFSLSLSLSLWFVSAFSLSTTGRVFVLRLFFSFRQIVTCILFPKHDHAGDWSLLVLVWIIPFHQTLGLLGFFPPHPFFFEEVIICHPSSSWSILGYYFSSIKFMLNFRLLFFIHQVHGRF
jgi:hypothetical protein